MKKLTVEEARKRAKRWTKAHPDESPVLRSCWNCNGSHEHLKDGKFTMLCIWCGHYYYNGVDITIFDEGEK